jgi:hypothetical protein
MAQSESLKFIFLHVIGQAAHMELEGKTVPRDLFASDELQDRILRAHQDLIAINPEYSDAFNSYKLGLSEINTMVNTLAQNPVSTMEKLVNGGPFDPDPVALGIGFEHSKDRVFEIYQALPLLPC